MHGPLDVKYKYRLKYGENWRVCYENLLTNVMRTYWQMLWELTDKCYENLLTNVKRTYWQMLWELTHKCYENLLTILMNFF
jgi:hypothetical protein